MTNPKSGFYVWSSILLRNVFSKSSYLFELWLFVWWRMLFSWFSMYFLRFLYMIPASSSFILDNLCWHELLRCVCCWGSSLLESLLRFSWIFLFSSYWVEVMELFLLWIFFSLFFLLLPLRFFKFGYPY